MRDHFAKTLYEIAKSRPNVFIVVADISPAGSMKPFQTDFPKNFINVGVAEQSMIGLCGGLALRGCTAFAYSIATFSAYRPFEQIRVDLCYQNLPVTVVGIGGGVSYSMLGGTHHAQEDIAIMGALPNMAILAPCDPLETQDATFACADRKGPTYLRLGKAGEPVLTATAPDPFVFGKIRLIKPGTDVAILSYGPIMKMAFDAASQIEKQGKSVAIYSVHTVKPLDKDGVAQVLHRYPSVAVVEEHSERGGLAGEVKQLAWEHRAPCTLTTFSLKDEFIHVYGSHADVLRAHGLSSPLIAEKILQGPSAKVQVYAGNQSDGAISPVQKANRRAG